MAASLYGPVVADHAKHPRNQGALQQPDLAHEAVNALCGDRIRLELHLREGRIGAAGFQGEGCMVALAAASVLTELVQGLSLVEAAALPDATLLAALQAQLRPSRIGCATLPLVALRNALARSR